MTTFSLRPLTESDFDDLITQAGGSRAFAENAEHLNADYLISGALIELKFLNEDGIAKRNRQEKIATLFRQREPDRPVIVIDPTRLPEAGQREYEAIIEGPIQEHGKKAAKQLKQSRLKHPDASCSVLMIINNGYMTIHHEEMKKITEKRIRRDTSSIDAVVVAGSYWHSDGMEGYLLHLMDCIQINPECPFTGYDRLRAAWGTLSDKIATEMIQATFAGKTKGAVADLEFDVDDVRYVKTAPTLGQSEIYRNGRPRRDSSGIESTPPPLYQVAPKLSVKKWKTLKELFPQSTRLGSGYDEWLEKMNFATEQSDQICPFIQFPFDLDEWRRSPEFSEETSEDSFYDYLNRRLAEKATNAAQQSNDIENDVVVYPDRYIFVRTEEIGQDQGNDISHIWLAETGKESEAKTLVRNARITKVHATYLAGAYAAAHDVPTIITSSDKTYAWT